uniref:Protein kinase domain-containing protein n=1 Tax=Angiostrongylus cantonensis TaxID=6313 RepID=A0A0K0DM02_ANGCA
KFFSVFDNPRKLGEGVYGEVFATKYNGQLTALKVFASGLYPEEFLAAWDAYDNAYESENDRPSEYASEQQLFVAIGMLANENQVLSVLFQIAISLVVAEERLEFEHRDLHVGNVLVVENDDNLEYVLSIKYGFFFLFLALKMIVRFMWFTVCVWKILRYRFSGGDMVLRSYGVKVHLIDFTLSRMSKGSFSRFVLKTIIFPTSYVTKN